MENVEIQFSTDTQPPVIEKGKFEKTNEGGVLEFCKDGARVRVILFDDTVRIINEGEISYVLPLDEQKFSLALKSPYGEMRLEGTTQEARYVIGSSRIFVDCKYTLIYPSGEKDEHTVKIIGRLL